MAAKPSSERIDESPVAAFHERSSGIRENARCTAIALENFARKSRAAWRALEQWERRIRGTKWKGTNSSPAKRIFNWSALARYSSTVPSFEAASIRILLLCAAFSES